MLFTAHALGAGAVGEQINNAFLAFLFGIFIHFVLDLIPHYDTTDGGDFTPRQWILAGADLAIGIIIMFLLGRRGLLHYPGFYFGMAGGVIPDIFSIVPPMKKITERFRVGILYQEIHERIQTKKISPFLGISVQIIIWILAILLLV